MESEELSKLKILEKNLKPLIEDNITDFVVFGSFVKGKYKPKDVDVAIFVKDEEKFRLEELSEVREKTKEIFEDVDTEVLEPQDLYTTDLGLRIILEGYSIRESDFLRKILGIRPYNIYQYSLKKLNRSEKTRLNRALKDLLDGIEGEKVGPGVVKVSRRHSGRVEDVLKRWEVWEDTKTVETFIY